VAIDYELPRAGAVTLGVYDAAGRRVVRLVGERQGPGRFRTEWDGRTQAGAAVPSGVYFYRLGLDGEAHTRKILLLRQ
jgi:flagellar hook assembly protein FlgD